MVHLQYLPLFIEMDTKRIHNNLPTTLIYPSAYYTFITYLNSGYWNVHPLNNYKEKSG